MALPSYESMAAGYAAMWKSMTVTRKAECDQAARRILAAKARYQAVERTTGVPWFWIGVVHMRESSNNFAGVLHNGEHIIGSDRKTRLVPEGRGPFATWEAAALDALAMHGLNRIKDWPIARLGYEAERFNGWGYIPRGVNSPYVWSGSQHYRGGKYVADGVFSYSAMDQQLGCLPVLKSLAAFDPEVATRIGNKQPSITSTIVKTLPTVAVPAGGAGAVLGLGWVGWAVAVAAVVIVTGAIVYLLTRRKAAGELPPVVDDPFLLMEHRSGKALPETSNVGA